MKQRSSLTGLQRPDGLCYIEAAVLIILVTFIASFLMFISPPSTSENQPTRAAEPMPQPSHQGPLASLTSDNARLGEPYSKSPPEFKPYSVADNQPKTLDQ